MVKGAFNSFSSYEDLEKCKAFFKDKDIRKFKLAVSQTFDSVQASADWLKRDTEDVKQVSLGPLRICARPHADPLVVAPGEPVPLTGVWTTRSKQNVMQHSSEVCKCSRSPPTSRYERKHSALIP